MSEICCAIIGDRAQTGQRSIGTLEPPDARPPEIGALPVRQL
jgi:hypothetical protein